MREAERQADLRVEEAAARPFDATDRLIRDLLWNDAETRALCYRLDGGEAGSELGAYYLFIILNSSPNSERVAIPSQAAGKRWYRVIDTSLPSGEDFLDSGKEVPLNPADFYLANPRTTVMLLGR